MTHDTKKESRGAGRVAFLARRDDFARLLEQGHTRRSIYEAHKANLGFGYKYFVKCVTKYIGKPAHEQAKPDPQVSPPPEQDPEGGPGSREEPSGSKASNTKKDPWEHDAGAGSKRTDLI